MYCCHCDAIVVWPARLGCDFMTSRVHALSRPSLLVVSEQPAKRDFHFFLDFGFLALLLSLFLNLNISHTCNCHALAMVAASETPPLHSERRQRNIFLRGKNIFKFPFIVLRDIFLTSSGILSMKIQ